MDWNTAAFVYLYGFAHQSPFLDGLIVFCAETFPVIVVVGLVIFLFSHEHGENEGFHNIIVILLSALLALLIVDGVKHIVGSIRPYAVLSDIHPLFGGTDPNVSFPSGHMTFFTALAASLFFYHRWIAGLFFLAAIVIGVARVAAGVHWPIDIIGGAFIGAGIAIITYKGYAAFFQEAIDRRFHSQGHDE